MLDSLDSPFIHAATSENFKSLVLDNSGLGPVLVNFCSKKAGPCLRQYPILDKLIHDYAGRLLLINVDTQTEFIFTKEYGIASVPTLKLFRNGEVVETLHGYQSEHDLVKMLDQYVTRDSDQTLASAIHQYSQGNQDKAYEMIANAIVEDPKNPRLPLAMCKLLRHEHRYTEAVKLIKSLPEDIRENNEIKMFYEIIWFYDERSDTQTSEQLIEQQQSSEADLDFLKQLFIQLVIEEHFEAALLRLVEMMEIDQSFDDNYAQTAMLRVFTLLGDSHPLIASFHPNLSRYTH